VYVALGMPYYVMALNSIRSLKLYNPDVPVVLVTDYSSAVPSIPGWGLVDKVVLVGKSADARTIKTSILSYVDADRNLFIDCDTEVLGSLEAGFFLLDHFDLAMRPHSAPLATKKGQFSVLGGAYKAVDMPHWNSGVIFFKKNERVAAFFSAWHREYVTGGCGFDQIPLVDAVFKSDIKICPLDLRWNGSTSHVRADKARSRILHYTSDVDKNVSARLLAIARELDGAGSLGVESALSVFLEKRKAARLAGGKLLSDMSSLGKGLHLFKRKASRLFLREVR